MSRIIFLDIDGVLNNAEWVRTLYEENRKKGQLSYFERHENEIDPTRVKMISDFAIEMNASIVISSSWRKLHPLYEINDMLIENGLYEGVQPIGITPSLNSGYRGEEVQYWLEQNPHVTSYVIFDDDGDFYPHQPLVKTSWEEGLLPIHIEQARDIFDK